MGEVRPKIGGKYRRTIGLILRYEVALWDDNEPLLLRDVGPYTVFTRWGACRMIRRWVAKRTKEQAQRDSSWSRDCG
jgi:hypothetical protein